MYTESDVQALAKAQAEFKKEYKIKSGTHTLISLGTSLLMLIVMVTVMLQFVFILQPVYGDGFAPNITESHYIVANRLAYKMRQPQRGEVILTDGRMYRIIAMPGETIKFYGGHIYIDGQLVEEEYIPDGVLTYPVYQHTEMTVPENSYFVMTDNRQNYDDSRQGLFLAQTQIDSVSKVMFVFSLSYK